MKKKKWVFLGYCPKCGKDVETDFCDECGAYTQEPEEDSCPSTRTSAKRDTDSKTSDRLRKRRKVQRVQKRVVEDRPERFPPR